MAVMFVMDGAVGEGKARGMQKAETELQIADFRFQIGRPVVARCEICNLQSEICGGLASLRRTAEAGCPYVVL
jgi:hypothetical protein